MKTLSRVGNHVLQLMLLIGGLALFTNSQAQVGDIEVVKDSVDTSYIPGQSVTYTISANNLGPGAVTGLTITDVFPAEFAAYVYNTQTLIGATVTSGGSGQGNASSNTPVSPGTLSAVVNINPGGSVVLVVNAVVRMSTTIDPLENTASLVLPGGFTDPDLTNNSSTFPLPLSGAPGGTGVGFTLCANLAGIAPLTVTTAGTVINTFFTPSTNTSVTTLTVGQRCLPTNGVTGIGATPFALSSLALGQKLLVMQMQDGNSMDVSDSATYGENIGNAGAYEYVEVRGAIGAAGCAANEIPITGSNGATLGLANAYLHNPTAVPKRVTQYVRVPQHTDITLSGAGTLAALPWDGLRGGVIAADASGSFDLGTQPSGVDATCAGFRGGGTLSQPVGLLTNRGPTRFRRTIAIGNGVKGEGLSGTPRLVFNGSGITDIGGADGYSSAGATARGAPGSAGGGGNSCDSVTNGPPPNIETGGGGGGGNGGRGGSGGTCNSNATTGVGAADTGGIQGRIFAGFTFNGSNNFTNTERPSGVGRVTMGSGGGAGAGNGNTGVQGAGGLGGGIILLSANSFLGTGDVVTNGCNGQAGGANGGGGGGGAGGTVVLLTNLSGNTTYAGIQVSVVGGIGGNAGVGNDNEDLRGPGGGGGSGRTYISRIANGASASTATSGADSGRTDFTPLLQAQQYGAAAGDNFVEQSNLNAYNSVPGAKPNFICSGGTVPVTLSDVKATVEGSQLVVNFGTASEAGTLGFRVYQDQLGNKDFALNRGQLTMAAGASTKPQRYEVRGENRGAKEIWIEEVETNGKSVFYGPYPLNIQVGVKDIAVETNWSAINAEQLAFRTLERSSIAGRSSGANTRAELKVSADGWYRITHEQLLAAGANFAGVSATQLRLQRGNQVVGVEVTGTSSFGAGSALSFFGESVKDSLYTDQAVYTLSAEGGIAQPSSFANIGALTAATSHIHTVKFAPNRGYSFSSPTNDPWYATRIVRNANNAGLATEVLNLSERQPSSSERLTVRVWGGTSFPAVVGDHTLAINVNGTQVATATFDGIVSQDIEAAIPANVLVDGDNQISVQLLTNAAPADLVYLESISISYQRKLKVEANGQLSFVPAVTQGESDRLFRDNFDEGGLSACDATEAGCQAFRVELTSPNARAFRVSDSQALALSSAKIKTVNGVSVMEFAGIANANERYVVTQISGMPSASVSAEDTTLLTGSNISYLIMTHPSFAGELAPLVAARQAQGFNVKVVNVESLYRSYTSGELSPLAISAYLSEAKQTWAGLKHVLFVGGDSYDYKNYLGNSSVSFVPTQYRRTHEVVSYAPVDMAYADLNADGRPDLSLGRLPVRTVQELRNVINKTLAYKQAGTARKLVWANDRDSNSYPFGGKSADFIASFPGWTSSRIDLNTYAVGDTANARSALVSQINAGQALLGFYGHSSPSNWTRESLLTAEQLNQGGVLTNAARPTSVVQFGCWGAYFVDPQYTSMTHAMLLNEGGAAVVLAASGLTEVASDELLAAKLLPKLNAGISFGEATQQSMSAIRAANPGAIDVWLGSSVLGDPALQLNN